jgi:hypothetical protein
VLVVNDIIGFAPKRFKHIKVYGNIRDALKQAVTAYKEDCASGGFPADEHANIIAEEEYKKVTGWLKNGRKVQWGGENGPAILHLQRPWIIDMSFINPP